MEGEREGHGRDAWHLGGIFLSIVELEGSRHGEIT
jgi:hypothetical protein